MQKCCLLCAIHISIQPMSQTWSWDFHTLSRLYFSSSYPPPQYLMILSYSVANFVCTPSFLSWRIRPSKWNQQLRCNRLSRELRRLLLVQCLGFMIIFSFVVKLIHKLVRCRVCDNRQRLFYSSSTCQHAGQVRCGRGNRTSELFGC